MKMKNVAIAIFVANLYYTQTANADTQSNLWTHTLSWQVEHPVLCGVMSGLSFGLWPSEFGNDAVVRSFNDIPAHQVQMFADANWGYVKSYSERVFEFWRLVGFSVWLAVLASGVYVWRKKAIKINQRAVE